MYVSKDVFVDYGTTVHRMGDSAKVKNGDFEIVGEGKVIQCYLIDGREKNITYTHALYTPTLNANLISVSTFDRAGLTSA